MRPMPMRNVEEIGGRNLMEKQSLEAVQELWNEWEIHCLILVSFGLQVFLLFAAGMRRHSASSVLRSLLWLAYLLADSVAIFVLGHLAVHASGPRHQLLLFWAPFVLLHLGGQDTITAFSKQDNELWTRHLLGLVSQVVLAGYVVSRSSWPDGRLLAAMVLMFLSGSFKYAGRTYCLYSARPQNLKVLSLKTQSYTVENLSSVENLKEILREEACGILARRFALMLRGPRGNRSQQDYLLQFEDGIDIMSVDVPLNQVVTILSADDLPRILADVGLQSSAGRCGSYECVAGLLVNCYERLYTKTPLLGACYSAFRKLWTPPLDSLPPVTDASTPIGHFSGLIAIFLFCYLSTPIALVLFTTAEKGGQLHIHSRADVTVSYILLGGAILLDLSAAFMFIFPIVRSNLPEGRIKSAMWRVQPAWSRKQWSEKLAQYSMIKRYSIQDTAGIQSVRQRIGKYLIACGVELLDPSLTHTPVTEDLKEYVFHKLLCFGTGDKQYWNFASFRGELALRRWMTNSAGPGNTALHKSISREDFPMSVLIWHFATDICYYNDSSASTDSDKMKKKMSRELSNYMMYLVFKCGVMLTSNSELVHENVHNEMKHVFAEEQSQQVKTEEEEDDDERCEMEAIMKVFKAKTEEEDDEQPASTATEIKEPEQVVDTDAAAAAATSGRTKPAAASHLQLLQRDAESLYSPVLPRARKVAQELIDIDDRWELIAAVWLDMLFYTAPRCRGAFHYQHLSTGGEFITHVLLLMRLLGPFLPPPSALNS